MIRLAPTKNLVDEEQVDTVIPCPQRLFQPVQSFLEFTHMELCPFLYKPLRLIHVDLYLQYFIQKWFFHVYLVELPVHGCSNCKNASNDDELGHMGKSLVKIHSSYFEISILNRTLCLKILPDAFLFMWNIHLHPTFLLSFEGCSISTYCWLWTSCTWIWMT